MSGKRDFLIDPVDYLRSVEQCPQFCPLLLWGCADGDLHGRNVLVTAVSDEVALPAAFDYADMGLDNLVGWDFVKLETELKVRALPRLHAHVGTWPEYHEAVLRFECHLAAATLAMHDEQEMPRTNLGSHGLQRLAEILLTIRQQARRHLGIQRLRDRQWLEEYYFLLACYGVYASRFDTYSGYPPPDRGGVISRRVSLPDSFHGPASGWLSSCAVTERTRGARSRSRRSTRERSSPRSPTVRPSWTSPDAR